jgi:WD40 repeat protein
MSPRSRGRPPSGRRRQQAGRAGARRADKKARIWAADGTLRATLTGHTRRVTAVAIAPDGSWLATTSADKTARIWAADGTARATLTGHRGRVTAVAISPDGSWLATASWDDTARIWVADADPPPPR